MEAVEADLKQRLREAARDFFDVKLKDWQLREAEAVLLGKDQKRKKKKKQIV